MGIPIQTIQAALSFPGEGLLNHGFRQGQAVEQHPITWLRLRRHLFSIKDIDCDALSSQLVLQLGMAPIVQSAPTEQTQMLPPSLSGQLPGDGCQDQRCARVGEVVAV